MKVMIKFIAFVLIVVTSTLWVASCSKPDKKNPSCSDRQRWDVKTLTDPQASNINYTPIKTTIADLISIPPQNTIIDNTPRFGIEFNTYSFQCHIREFKLSNDGDYHLVLEDLSEPSKTMIGEIPDPFCESVQQSIRVYQITQTRKDFQNTLLVTAQVDTSVYTITGVAFYDRVHGQVGVAPTGIEIHPILSIIKN